MALEDTGSGQAASPGVASTRHNRALLVLGSCAFPGVKEDCNTGVLIAPAKETGCSGAGGAELWGEAGGAAYGMGSCLPQAWGEREPPCALSRGSCIPALGITVLQILGDSTIGRGGACPATAPIQGHDLAPLTSPTENNGARALSKHGPGSQGAGATHKGTSVCEAGWGMSLCAN